MNKVFLTAGHHANDPGAVNAERGKSEANLTRELRDKIKAHLEELGVEVWVDDDADTLAVVVGKIKKQSSTSDIICDIHFNAFNKIASGVEVIVPERYTTKEHELATKLCSMISGILRLPNRRVKTEKQSNRGRLAMMTPNGVNVLIEVCFIDNNRDLDSYLANKEEVAKEIANLLREAASR